MKTAAAITAPPSAILPAVATGPARFVEVSLDLVVEVSVVWVPLPVVVASLLEGLVVVPAIDDEAAETRLE